MKGSTRDDYARRKQLERTQVMDTAPDSDEPFMRTTVLSSGRDSKLSQSRNNGTGLSQRSALGEKSPGKGRETATVTLRLRPLSDTVIMAH